MTMRYIFISLYHNIGRSTRKSTECICKKGEKILVIGVVCVMLDYALQKRFTEYHTIRTNCIRIKFYSMNQIM